MIFEWQSQPKGAHAQWWVGQFGFEQNRFCGPGEPFVPPALPDEFGVGTGSFSIGGSVVHSVGGSGGRAGISARGGRGRIGGRR